MSKISEFESEVRVGNDLAVGVKSPFSKNVIKIKIDGRQK